MKILIPYFIVFSSYIVETTSFRNGWADSPPMGWMSDERFGCNVDCSNYPSDCISDGLIRSMADAMVDLGLKDDEYQFLVIGDCWMDKNRTKNGLLQADLVRFPFGMKSLADYVHSRGLSLGLLLSIGNVTCHQYPGSLGHYGIDAETLAGWGVDLVKATGCGIQDVTVFNTAYVYLANTLIATGRKILYSCDWPYRLLKARQEVNYSAIASMCHMFRSSDEMIDSWDQLQATLKFAGDNCRMLANYSGPSHWNDPDQLLVGDFGLSESQQRIQMALWSILAAPLFVSADLRKLSKISRDILTNKAALAVNQDPLGIMGLEIATIGQIHVWRKPILPNGSFALAFQYDNISGGPARLSIKLSDIGLITCPVYNFTDIFTGLHLGLYKPWHTFDCEINPTGVLFVSALATL